MKTVVRQMGNSQGVIIPKPLLAEIGLQTNDPIDIKVKKGKIVLAPLGRSPREGWADDAKALRDKGEAGLVSPNQADPDASSLKP